MNLVPLIGGKITLLSLEEDDQNRPVYQLFPKAANPYPGIRPALTNRMSNKTNHLYLQRQIVFSKSDASGFRGLHNSEEKQKSLKGNMVSWRLEG